MYATVRRYTGNADLADKLAPRSDEVTSLIKEAAGFVAYYLLRAGNDTISVTVCDDQRGADESNQLAANWIRENMPEIASSAPEISAGEVVITASR